MHIQRLTTAAELDAAGQAWNALAGDRPFLRYEWLGSWWRHFGEPHGDERAVGEPFVLAVYPPGDSRTPVGLAPWYRARSWTGGRTLRFLGDGITCTEYPTVLCQNGWQSSVTAGLAEWLDQQSPQAWDAMEFSACDPRDDVLPQLAAQLEARGHQVHPITGDACWRLELPPDWETYLAWLSKTNRRRARKLLRTLDEESRWHHGTVTADELNAALQTMIQLHQRRRASRKETGCFDSPHFCRFFEDATRRLFASGMLKLDYVRLEGRIAAVDYNVLGSDTIYTYQSGIDPDALQHTPGRMLMLATIRRAIDHGYAAIDLLRGDEPYKANFRARRTETIDWRIVRGTRSARCRQVAWLARRQTRAWVRQGLATARSWQTAASQTLAHAWATGWSGKPAH